MRDATRNITGVWISVVGKNSPIQELSPLFGKWYYDKMNEEALRCEVGVIESYGEIVWVNGPFTDGRTLISQ